MESKLDIGTIVNAVGVAAYAALAIRYVAVCDLGFSLEEIRGASMGIGVVIAALLAVVSLGERLRKTR